MKEINKKKNLLYIAELNLPNESAQSLQILKMCDAFSNFFNVKLYLFNSSKKFSSIKKLYLIKNDFKIKSNFKLNKKFNLISRVNLFYKLICELKKNDYKYIYTRSVFISSLLTICGYKNTLEIHLPSYSITKILFFFSKMINNKCRKFVLLHKNLKKYYQLKKNYIICDDAVDLNDFKYFNKPKKNSCIYIGSLFKGKGFELIFELSKRLKGINFIIYANFLNKKIKKLGKNNLKIYKHVTYKKIPKILSRYDVALLPYSKKTFINAKNITNEKYISPLKLFDYLASRKIIIASRLRAYDHILKNNFNSILVSPEDIAKWEFYIKDIFKNKNKYNFLKKNAYKTVNKFTWNKRAKKIISFI